VGGGYGGGLGFGGAGGPFDSLDDGFGACGFFDTLDLDEGFPLTWRGF